MTILEDRIFRDLPLANRELHAELRKALSDAKRLRRRIRRLLSEARRDAGGSCCASACQKESLGQHRRQSSPRP
jgi:hypothetical protein